MKEENTDLTNQLIKIVNQKTKVKIPWLAVIFQLTEEEIKELAIKNNLEIEDEYLVSFESDANSSKDLSSEEYEKLYPKPAPTFCEAKRSKNEW